MAKIDSSLITATGRTVNVKYTYEHPTLRPYEKRAEKRLTFILEQLDLGSDANLGYTKVTWLADEFVQVRYLAMEGVLQPIIVVRVEFRPGKDHLSHGFVFGQTLADEEEPDIPETPEPEYIPYAWIGIHAGDHALSGGVEGNVNKDFWGYPSDPHLVGFEPSAGGIGIIRDLTTSVESLSGSIIIGQAWADRTGNGAADQKYFQVNGGQSYEMNEFGQQQGTFQDGDWHLTHQGVVMASKGNMLALEHLDTFVTAPRAAFTQPGSPSTPDFYPRNYWKRSIIIPGPLGVVFPSGAESDTIDVGGGVTAAVSATYSGGKILGTINSGRYEIGCFAMNYHCEATTARYQIRVVTGAVDPNGGPTQQLIYDFFPLGIADTCGNHRQNFVRVVSLGGNEPCSLNAGNPEDNVFGPNDGGAGWWQDSIWINVETGAASVEPARRHSPYFGDGGCSSARQHSCNDPQCIGGCVGEDVTAPSHSLDYPYGFTVSFDGGNEINPGVIDLRGGVLWHMARVTQVDSGTGHICFVKLQGNDGAQGGSCAGCQAFSYGHTMRANGYRGVGLGQDLRDVEQSSFIVGELVTVVGWTDVHDAPCLAAPGDWRLIVVPPHDDGEDFTSLYWYHLRCPPETAIGRNAVSKYFEGVEHAYKNRSLCQGGPIPVTCGCSGGQWRCLG